MTPVPIGNAPTVKTRAKINPCGGKKQLESTHQTRWAMARGIHPMKPFFLVKSVWITVKSREKSQKNPIQSLWTTMKLTFNKLRSRRFSEPTFRPPTATNHWKNTVFRDLPTFSRTCIFFLLALSLLWSSLFYSSLLSDSSHLCFSSVHIVESLTSKLPSING